MLRKGGTAELSSVVTQANFHDIKFKTGIARTNAGQPMASLEMVTVIDLESVDAPNGGCVFRLIAIAKTTRIFWSPRSL